MRNPFKLTAHSNTRRALASALCLALAILLGGGAAVAEKLSSEDVAVEKFVELVNGTWILAERFSPDGIPHTWPLKGRMKIELARQSTKLVGPRALGHVSASEFGIWDPYMSNGVPAEALGKPFFIETAGLWEVTIDRSRLATSAGGVPFRVSQANTIRGSFAPFVKGLLTQTDFPMVLSPAPGREPEAVSGPSSLKLATSASLTRPEAFRGRRVPSEWSEPVNFKNAEISREDLERCIRSYAEFTVTERQLTVTWGNGIRDVWYRQ